MKEKFNRIFRNSKIEPPINILNNFIKLYGETINTEWYNEMDYYEAIFYNEGIEHIVSFGKDGKLITIKKNLPLTEATRPIRDAANKVGELMNLIEIHKNGHLFYEIIARDINLIRHYLLLDSNGQLLEKEKL